MQRKKNDSSLITYLHALLLKNTGKKKKSATVAIHLNGRNAQTYKPSDPGSARAGREEVPLKARSRETIVPSKTPISGVIKDHQCTHTQYLATVGVIFGVEEPRVGI